MAKGAINVKIEGEYTDKDIKRAIKDIESLRSQAGPTAKSFSLMEGGWANLGKVAAIGAAAFAAGSAVLIKNAVEAASTFEQTAGAADQLFGEASSAKAKAWAATTSTAMGLSRNSALDALNTFGIFAKTAGLTGDAAVGFSRDIVQLAADMAAFKGTSVEDAIQSVGAALRGERDPIEKYGQILTATSVEAEASALGFEKVNGQLSAQAKIFATKSLIKKNNDLLGVTGQNAREADTFAGSLSRVSASLEDLQLSFGEGFMQGFADEMKRASDAADGMKGMESSARILGETFGSAIPIAIGWVTTLVQVVQSMTLEISYQLLNLANNIGIWSNEARDFLGLISDEEGEVNRQRHEAWGQALADAKAQTAYEIFYGKAADSASDAGIALDDAGTAAETAADGFANAASEASATEQAMKDLKDAVSALQDRLSLNKSVDDFAKGLRDLDDTLEGNKRTFKGLSDSAIENKDTLRTAFSDAADIVQGFVDEGKISADQFDGVFAGSGKKIVDDFVAQGFSRKEIKAFLKSEGLWTDELAAIFSKGNNRKSLEASERLGYDLGRGISVGIGASKKVMVGSMTMTINDAIQAGKDEAGIQSPSKKTRDEIGVPLADGIIQGLASKKDDIRSAAEDSASAVIDAADEILSRWDDKLVDLEDKLDQAKTIVADWSKTTRDSIIGAFDLNAAYENALDKEGKVVGSKWLAGVDSQLEGMQWYSNVLNKIKEQGPQAQGLIDYLISQGAGAGGEMGQAMITAGIVPEMVAKFNQVQTTADTLTAGLIPTWLQSGVDSAQATYEGFKANFGQGGPARQAIENLMDRLAKSMKRTTTITVKTIYEAAGMNYENPGFRAKGGPVYSGKPYVVGERGPELFVPQVSGTIIPNGDLPMASGGVRGGDGASLGGNSYNITVQAGVGDPRVIGQQVVEYIKRFEAANGNVFAAA